MGLKKLFGITTELKHLDLQEILDNHRKPSFWKKSWCVFKTKDFECIWKMTYINIEDNSISSRVVLHYHGKHNARDRFWGFGITPLSYSCRSIPIDNADYTQLVFNRNILETIIYTIDALELRIIRNTYDYKEAERLERDEVAKLKDIANDFLDSEGVKNDDIRQAYIDSYVSKATRYAYTNNVENTCYRRYYPTARLMASSWLDNKKKFDEESKIVKEKKGITKKIMYQIWKSRKELDSDDYIAEAEKLLEGV